MQINGGNNIRGRENHRIVVIGLDAFDVDLLQRWSEEGRLPFLKTMMESGVWTPLRSTSSLFGDSPWPSLNTGVSPAKHAFYNHLQIKRGTTQIERVDARHCRYLPFWNHLRNSGKKVALLDVPKTFPVEGLDGVQICAWGEHYPLLKKPTSLPQDAVADLISRFGKYPHPREVTYARRAATQRRIHNMLSANLDKKRRATEFLMTRGDWDFFMSVFSEVHYMGHESYHHYDKTHWAHEAGTPGDICEGMPRLYTQMDQALSRIFRHVPEDATYFIVCVHGFSTNYSANHLMPEVLVKLGYTVPSTCAEQSNATGALLQRIRLIRNLFPQGARDFINTHLVPQAVHDHAQSSEFSSSVHWPQTRAFFLPSDHFQGFISINLKGREPCGTVEPGPEFDALCHELSLELKQLVNPDTGKTVVHEVVKISDVYEGPSALELPDLVVQWTEDALTNSLQHPRFGMVSHERLALRRTQHAPDGFMIAGGKQINREARVKGASTLDIAPTLLYLMGQEIPVEMDGRVLFELIQKQVKAF